MPAVPPSLVSGLDSRRPLRAHFYVVHNLDSPTAGCLSEEALRPAGPSKGGGLGSPEVHLPSHLLMSSCPFLTPHCRLSAGVSTSSLSDGFLVIHVSPGANKHKVTDGHRSPLRATARRPDAGWTTVKAPRPLLPTAGRRHPAVRARL